MSFKIEPKFDVKQILQHVFNSNEGKSKLFWIVREIKTVTCSAGTQIFYICAPLIEKEHFDGKKQREMGNFDKPQMIPEHELEPKAEA